MKETLKHFSTLLSLAVLLGISMMGCALERKAMPQAVDGVIELSDWDFEKGSDCQA